MSYGLGDDFDDLHQKARQLRMALTDLLDAINRGAFCIEGCREDTTELIRRCNELVGRAS